MKRNNLTTAVIAGIAGVAGIASVSNAVNLNSDGVGQVLVYPYYTVNNGNNTLISIVNTTNETKAVKVRFLEGKNSRECLDFNLYLSPYDVWTAALSPTTATEFFAGSYAGDETVQLTSWDTSCVNPGAIAASVDGDGVLSSGGYQFLPWGFDPQGDGSPGSGYDEGGENLQRCTEGHFEVIEMGVVSDTVTNLGAATAFKHGPNGVPADCSVASTNWHSVSGAWTANSLDGLSAPTGGLFGSASIINVNAGTDLAYNADAIEGYTVNIQHSDPGELTPNLATGGSSTSNIFDNAMVRTDFWLESSIQAVSALYMHNEIYGEYALTDGIGANTEWVVTFPTKFAYVDPNVGYQFGAVGPAPYEPFTVAFEPASAGALATACEEYNIRYWDREEQEPAAGTIIDRPSPPPPGIVSEVPIFCWETNVLELHDVEEYDDTLPSSILGSNLTTHFQTRKNNVPEYFDTGWLRIAFTQSTDDNFAGTPYTGLPVTGFAVQRYTNATLVDGTVLANYGGLFQHRYSKSIGS